MVLRRASLKTQTRALWGADAVAKAVPRLWLDLKKKKRNKFWAIIKKPKRSLELVQWKSIEIVGV